MCGSRASFCGILYPLSVKFYSVFYLCVTLFSLYLQVPGQVSAVGVGGCQGCTGENDTRGGVESIHSLAITLVPRRRRILEWLHP